MPPHFSYFATAGNVETGPAEVVTDVLVLTLLLELEAFVLVMRVVLVLVRVVRNDDI